MALNIKDKETDELAREVARLAGEGLTEAVRKSLKGTKTPACFAKRQTDTPG
jgi:hypothetical protein